MTSDLAPRAVLSESSSTDVSYRKVQLLGKSSLAITLPKKWAQELGIKPGDHVLLCRVGDIIVLKPSSALRITQTAEGRVREVEVSSDNIWRALRRIVGLYLSGCCELVIVFKDSSQGVRQIVKNFIRGKLSGAEIIDEKSEVIHVRFITEFEEIPIQSLLKRMCNVAIGILRDGLSVLMRRSLNTSTQEVTEDATLRDEEIDRMYLLIYRLVNLAVQNRALMQRLGVVDPRELVAALMVAKSIERCGDHATRVAYLARNLVTAMTETNMGKLDAITSLVELGFSTCDILRDATQSFVSKDVELAQSVLDRRLELRKFSVKLISEAIRTVCPLSIQMSEVLTYVVLMLESIRRVLAYSYDIAEITIDTYSEHT